MSGLLTPLKIGVAVLAVASLAWSCGDDGGDGPSSGGNAAPRHDHPTGESDVVLRLDVSGGFVPVDVAFREELPQFVVYGDGTVITHGPQIMIYPGPALPNLLTRELDDEGLQRLLDAVEDAGLLTEQPLDFGQPPVTDLPTTRLRVVSDGIDVTHEAYALGFEDETGSLTPAQHEARDALQSLIEELTDLEALAGSGHVGPEESYEPSGYLLRARAEEPPADMEPAPTVEAWPIAEIDLAATDCPVTGELGARVGELFSSKSMNAYFTQDGTTYAVAVRPILPDEPPCE